MNIKIRENQSLQIELNGYQVKDQVILKGLLSQKLKPSIKMKLSRLSEIVNKESERHDTINKELFDKYGEIKGDAMVIKPENLEVYQKEYSELLDSEFELDLKKIFGELNPEVFDTFEDEAYYPVFYKLMSNYE